MSSNNDVKAEGKGRSMQRPRKRLKFENILTVVWLLFLACTRIASLTDYSTSKVARIVVRHKVVFVRAEGYVSQQSSTPEKPKGKFFCEWKRLTGLLACLWSGWIDYVHVVVQHFSRSVTISFLCLTTNGLLVLAFLFLVLCGVSIHVFVHIRIQVQNSNGTTVRTFSNFNLLRGRCMLLPFSSTLTSLCAPGKTTPPHPSYFATLWIWPLLNETLQL